MNEFPFAQIALKHIRVLVEGIGPRPAGSDQERKAFKYVVGELNKFGYKVKINSTPYAPLPRLNLTGFIIALVIIIAGYFYLAYPWLTLWMPFITIGILQIDQIIEGRRVKSGESQFIFTDLGVGKEEPILIVCSHIDSAKAIGYSNATLRWMYGHTLMIVQRVAVLIALFSLTSILGLDIPGWVGILVKMVCVVTGLWYFISETSNQVFHHSIYSPGAWDNASGVGVLLSLAEYFNKKTQGKLRLCFLITGAEETGLHGSEGFSKIINGFHSVAVINLDMVGAGKNLFYIEREGILIHRRTNKLLNRLLRRAYPEIKPMVNTIRSGDYASFLKNGIPTVSLQSGGSRKAEIAYHSKFDTLDIIDPESLIVVSQTVVKFIEIISSDNLIEKCI